MLDHPEAGTILAAADKAKLNVWNPVSMAGFQIFLFIASEILPPQRNKMSKAMPVKELAVADVSAAVAFPFVSLSVSATA